MLATQHNLVQLLPRLVAAGGARALAMRGGSLLGCPLHFAAEHAALDAVRFLVTQAPDGGCGGRAGCPVMQGKALRAGLFACLGATPECVSSSLEGV